MGFGWLPVGLSCLSTVSNCVNFKRKARSGKLFIANSHWLFCCFSYQSLFVWLIVLFTLWKFIQLFYRLFRLFYRLFRRRTATKTSRQIIRIAWPRKPFCANGNLLLTSIKGKFLKTNQTVRYQYRQWVINTIWLIHWRLWQASRTAWIPVVKKDYLIQS